MIKFSFELNRDAKLVQTLINDLSKKIQADFIFGDVTLSAASNPIVDEKGDGEFRFYYSRPMATKLFKRGCCDLVFTFSFEESNEGTIVNGSIRIKYAILFLFLIFSIACILFAFFLPAAKSLFDLIIYFVGPTYVLVNWYFQFRLFKNRIKEFFNTGTACGC